MRRTIGLVLLLVVIASVIGLRFLATGSGPTGLLPGTAPSQITVVGDIGGEKALFLQNPRVREILHDSYGLTINATTRGSMDMSRLSPAGKDFLWPANQAALDVFNEGFPGKATRTTSVFNSPLVLYSWAEVVDALARAGVAEQSGGSYFVDLVKLVGLNQDGKRWRDLGLTGNPNRIAVITTDPGKSSSGALYAALLTSVLTSTGDVVEVPTETSVTQALPRVRSYYEDLGRLSDGSRDLFDQYKTQGPSAFPLIADYESLLLELSNQPRERAAIDVVKARLRVLYPRPTIWATHPFITLNPNGARLLDALTNDDEIRRIAWEQHGFRAGLSGIQYSTSMLAEFGLMETIQQVVPLPRPRVMEQILAATQ